MEQVFEKRIENWLEEQGIEWNYGQPASWDEEGNPYVTLFIGGEKPEGEEVKLYYTRLCDELVAHLKETLLQFLNGRKRIVWRFFPALQHDSYKDDFDGGTKHRYQIRCRLTAYPQ